METKIAGRAYVTGRLDAFKQMNIVAKLSPMMLALQKAMAGLAPADFEAAKTDDAKAIELFASSSNPMVEAFAKMSNEDREYVVGACLDVCQVRDPTAGALSPLRVAGRLMFDDLDFPAIARLTFIVIKENLGDFFLNPLGVMLTPKS